MEAQVRKERISNQSELYGNILSKKGWKEYGRREEERKERKK